MHLKVMPKRAVRAWVSWLRSRNFKVIAPKAIHGQYAFEEIDDQDDIVLDYPTSILPPKKHLLPPRESLFRFSASTLEARAQIPAEPTVLFGVHTCDMHAIQLLDRVHATGHADQHYQARRATTYLVSIECLEPCSPGSFCKSMGTLTVPSNFDLHLVELGDDYGIEVGSEKGATLLEGFVSVWDATEQDRERVNAIMADKWTRFTYRLDFDVTELPSLLADSQKSPLWDELGDLCLACGMCTKVCPTCYCFDVTDEIDLQLEHGERVRTWDSCQIEKFALVAGGHNFRSSQAFRQRHRFMRKGKYQFEAFGQMSCVGCGRCSTACLVHINPIDTFNTLYRLRQDAQKTSGEPPIARERSKG